MVRSHRATLLRVTIAALAAAEVCAASCSRPAEGGGAGTKRSGCWWCCGRAPRLPLVVVVAG